MTKIKINKKTILYELILFFIIFVEMHYFSLFTFPETIEFVLYENRAKWIAPLSIILALICYLTHKKDFDIYSQFIYKYLAINTISIIFISFYTVIKYPLNPLMTTYGFACYYLYSFLTIPILYIFRKKGGIKGFFNVINIFLIIEYLVVIIDGISFIRRGTLIFNNVELVGGSIRDGKVRLSASAFSTLLMLYNFYNLYNCKNPFNKSKVISIVSFLLGIVSILVLGNSRINLLTISLSIFVLILIGNNRKYNKVFSLILLTTGIFILLTSNIIISFIESMSVNGDYAGSTIARVGAYRYYLSCFLKNPIFANGFVGDTYYYDIVHGGNIVYFQGAYVDFYYDDVGIIGQLALLGIFIVPIYLWPLCRFINIAWNVRKYKNISEGKFLIAILLFLICTSPTLIVFDACRVILFPLLLAILEYTNYEFKCAVIKSKETLRKRRANINKIYECSC